VGFVVVWFSWWGGKTATMFRLGAGRGADEEEGKGPERKVSENERIKDRKCSNIVILYKRGIKRSLRYV